MTWMKAAVAGALAMAAVSTIGDFVWATWIPRHRPVYGMTHGTLLFLGLGLFLGILARRAMRGAIWGAFLGFVAAGSFYVLAPLGGYVVMFAVWMGTWFAVSALHIRLQRMRDSVSAILLRGVIAAIAFTGAFYAISGIWFPFNPTGWDYLWHFGGWTVAYLAGFAPLFIANSAPGPAPTQ
jgi:hypothetical protein